MPRLAALVLLVCLAGCDSTDGGPPFARGDRWGSETFRTAGGAQFDVDLHVEAVSGDRVSGRAEVTGGADVASAGTYPTTFSGVVEGDDFDFSTGELPDAAGVPDGLAWTCDVEASDRMVCTSSAAAGVVFDREP